VAEPTHQDVTDVLGIDLGIVNIATDSDGTVHSSSQVNDIRLRRGRLRTKLQRKGSRSAKRKLRKLSGREARFAKDVNHCLSKQIVVKAKDTARAIALEDLSGIRQRITVPRFQRAVLHRWSFFQLRSFLEYKARLAGVPVILVDPRNTSRTCPHCGCVDRRNRPSQSQFVCVSCGYAGHADTIAAVNIRGRAVANRPKVARVEAKAVELLSITTGLRQSAATSCPL